MNTVTIPEPVRIRLAHYLPLFPYYLRTLRERAEQVRAYLARNWETTVLAYLASIVVMLEILILTAALDWNLAFMITAAVLILACCAGIITALYTIERLNR